MALSTFGAIMGFAAEMVKGAGGTYQALSEKARDPVLKATLEELAGEAAKNQSLMEKTRRENVTEMILEPITGLHPEDYEVDLTGWSQAEDTDLLKIALLLEERGNRFFRDASAKVPLPEVARIFRKLGQKKEENLTKLQSLGLNQTLNRGTPS
jgi:rubrerythrin